MAIALAAQPVRGEGPRFKPKSQEMTTFRATSKDEFWDKLRLVSELLVSHGHIKGSDLAALLMIFPASNLCRAVLSAVGPLYGHPFSISAGPSTILHQQCAQNLTEGATSHFGLTPESRIAPAAARVRLSVRDDTFRRLFDQMRNAARDDVFNLTPASQMTPSEARLRSHSLYIQLQASYRESGEDMRTARRLDEFFGALKTGSLNAVLCEMPLNQDVFRSDKGQFILCTERIPEPQGGTLKVHTVFWSLNGQNSTPDTSPIRLDWSWRNADTLQVRVTITDVDSQAGHRIVLESNLSDNQGRVDVSGIITNGDSQQRVHHSGALTVTTEQGCEIMKMVKLIQGDNFSAKIEPISEEGSLIRKGSVWYKNGDYAEGNFLLTDNEPKLVDGEIRCSDGTLLVCGEYVPSFRRARREMCSRPDGSAHELIFEREVAPGHYRANGRVRSADGTVAEGAFMVRGSDIIKIETSAT
ncbi:MAG: hypothetical protein O3A01_02665 [bacterium]|nr:hypothetical protein [bacterium]